MAEKFAAGEPYDARKVARLAKKIEATKPMRGLGVRVLRRPWGYIPQFQASSSYEPPIWRIRLRGGGDDLKLTIDRGFINGVQPVIGTSDGKAPFVPIAGVAATKDKPAVPQPELTVGQDAFDPELNWSLLYLRVEFSRDWVIQQIRPVALPKKPKTEPFVAHKLLAFILNKSGAITVERFCFQNLGLGTLFDRRTNGFTRYAWYAV